MRSGKKTPTEKVEGRGGELLEEHPSPEEQGRIHYQLAHVHAQSAQKDPELVIEHAQRALGFPLDPALRLRAYVYWGDAVRILHGRKKAPYAEGRRLAARVYLEGLKETQRYRIPEKRPTLPGVDAFDIMPENSADHREAVERHERQMAARKQAEIDETLWEYRRVIVGQIVEMYTHEPLAATELRDLATRVLDSPAAVDALMKVIEENGGLKDDPMDTPANTIVPFAEPRPWRLPAIFGIGALGIVAAGLIVWVLQRGRRSLGPAREVSARRATTARPASE